jgi:hypothetical protein
MLRGWEVPGLPCFSSNVLLVHLSSFVWQSRSNTVRNIKVVFIHHGAIHLLDDGSGACLQLDCFAIPRYRLGKTLKIKRYIHSSYDASVRSLI